MKIERLKDFINIYGEYAAENLLKYFLNKGKVIRTKEIINHLRTFSFDAEMRKDRANRLYIYAER